MVKSGALDKSYFVKTNLPQLKLIILKRILILLL